jgi:hypothetical protein
MLRALGQLAARELGLAHGESGAVLAPRLPSRYEPADAGAHAAYDDARVDAATPHEIRAAKPTTDAAPIATDRSVVSVHADAHRDAAEPVASAQPTRVDDHAAFDPRDRVESSSTQPNAHITAVPMSVAPTPAVTQPLPSSPNDEARPLRKLKQGEPLAPSSVHAVEHADATQPKVTKPRAELPREASALRPVPLPPPIARAPSKSTNASSVQITIGRIEIRASKEAPAPASAPSRSSSSPSLSTYLRRRSEGGRS